MLQLKLSRMVLILFCDILFIVAAKNTRKNADFFVNLINHDGWKHLSDIKKVKYWNHVYTPQEIFNSIDTDNFTPKIRATTLLLGCSYAKDLQKYFHILNKFNEHCIVLMDKGSEMWWNCTTDYLKSVGDLKPLASMIIESLFAIEALHVEPLKITGRTPYIFYNTLIKLINIQNEIQKNRTTKNDLSKSRKSLKQIDEYLRIRKLEVENKMYNYCWPHSYDFDLECTELEIKYVNLIQKEKTLQYHSFLSSTFDEIIGEIIWNNYYTLGFEFDPNIQMIVTPVPFRYHFKSIKKNAVTKETGDPIQIELSYAELESRIYNQVAPNLINYLKKEWTNWSECIDTPNLIDFLKRGLDYNTTEKNKETYNEEIENQSESINTPKFINFLEKGLKPDAAVTYIDTQNEEETELIDFFKLEMENQSKREDMPQMSNYFDQRSITAPLKENRDRMEIDRHKTFHTFL